MNCLPCLFSSFGEDHKQDGSSSPWLSSHTNEAYGVGIPTELAKQLNEITLSIDQKAASCFGDSCTDRIPTSAKCNTDATTVNYATGDEFTLDVGTSNVIRIELRHSPKCNSSWAKAVAPANSTMYLQDESGSKYSAYLIPKDDLPDHHTEMVSGELRLRACVQSSRGNRHLACTGFVQGSSNE